MSSVSQPMQCGSLASLAINVIGSRTEPLKGRRGSQASCKPTSTPVIAVVDDGFTCPETPFLDRAVLHNLAPECWGFEPCHTYCEVSGGAQVTEPRRKKNLMEVNRRTADELL